MMENLDDFEKRLQNLKKPDLMTEHQMYLKLPLLHARKSAAIGWWLVALPCFMLACVIMKEIFKADYAVIDTFFNTLSTFDRAHGWWFSPLLFFIFPLMAAAMNLLALLNVIYDKAHKELIITIKLRFWNLFLIVLGFALALIIGFYVIIENSVEKSMHHLEQLKQIEKTK
ncbi:MAG: hypothetical protein R2822_29640 [Spirosomataceae bacterium]